MPATEGILLRYQARAHYSIQDPEVVVVVILVEFLLMETGGMGALG